jgi:hypothetical protein
VIDPVFAIGFVTVSQASSAFLQLFAVSHAFSPQHDFTCLIKLPVDALSLVSRYPCLVLAATSCTLELVASPTVNVGDVWDGMVESVNRGLPILTQPFYCHVDVSKLFFIMFLSLTKLVIRVIFVRDLDDTSSAAVAIVVR